MAEAYQRQHALAYRALDAAPRDAVGVQMWVEAASGQLCLRGDSGGRFAAIIESVWGVALPVAANTVSSQDDDERNDSGQRRILWLGPDEWLAVCADDEVHALHTALDQALAGEHALVSDVSHSRVVIALRGAHARDVLSKGCSLDLDAVAFGAGQCAQTALARAHMLLHQFSNAPCYHVYAHRSYAGYIYAWLEDAAREYMSPLA